MTAHSHACYDAALAQAVSLVTQADNFSFCATVYIDRSGARMYVRPSTDPQPLDTDVVAIAQRWDSRTVQLRFDGAYSEFVGV